MKIENYIPAFLDFWESVKKPTLLDLESYLADNDDVYEKYFPIHCPRTEERLSAALQKYAGKVDDIRSISANLPSIIEEVNETYRQTFDFDVELTFKLIVGTFGSNAFVTRDNKREIYFAVEKLSAEPEHLRVITAHEIGHVAHFSMATKGGMDWSEVDWGHGLTTLFTEGAATYLSKRTVPGLEEPVYFTYDDEGEPWVKCFEENKAEVKRRFLEDALGEWDMAKEKEWFRLSGGSYFGYNRIGYLLGTDYVEHLVERLGEDAALTFWNGNDVKADIIEWLGK
ncbi:aminopeptidase [Sporosarcina sp. ACRSL]|uniref:aminopeptidase n=1 Tax=Sporosarcina sp. ACRSL TaxID=2918215 RepID=UPI001EF6547C|nr:aminopeptidase [Sporosarcina sp. ACRSL]MCG7343510.1 aminopeptidase [Sporosarcina sp. ACRSL]